jgi:hypothetical protein
MGVGGQDHAPAALPPRKGPGICCTGREVGPRGCLVGCEKSGLPSGIFYSLSLCTPSVFICLSRFPAFCILSLLTTQYKHPFPWRDLNPNKTPTSDRLQNVALHHSATETGGIRSLYRPASSESLYRLSYPVPHKT